MNTPGGFLKMFPSQIEMPQTIVIKTTMRLNDSSLSKISSDSQFLLQWNYFLKACGKCVNPTLTLNHLQKLVTPKTIFAENSQITNKIVENICKNFTKFTRNLLDLYVIRII